MSINYFEDDWNVILGVDSYKVSHNILLPEGLKALEDYAEARGGDFKYICFAGFIPMLRMLQGVQVTKEKIQEAKFLMSKHFGTDKVFDEKVWDIIVDKYEGKLPIEIWALPEGSVIEQKNVVFKVIPLADEFADLAAYLETILMRVWYPISVATNSLHAADVARYYFNKTSDNYDGWKFLLHDFGSRGVTGREQGQVGGAMHLLSFYGTDNIDGIRWLMKHYDNENWQKRYTVDYELKRGFSVPASEHMVMSIEGRAGELNVYRRILNKFSKGELKNTHLSLVSDTYDIYNICEKLATDPELSNLIKERTGNTVIRPDSGDPFEVIRKMLDILSKHFGYTYNSKGYKVLNYNVKILQGDGINLNSYVALIRFLCDEHKWSIDNFVFGSGGGLLMTFNRDTTQFAIKCSHATYKDGTEIDVYKDPITGSGKKSKKGKLWSFKIDGKFETYNEDEMKELGLTKEDSLLKPVFRMGEVLVTPSIEEVSERMIREFDAIDRDDILENKELHIEILQAEKDKEDMYYNMLFNINSPQKDLTASIVRRDFYIKEIEKINNL